MSLRFSRDTEAYAWESPEIVTALFHGNIAVTTVLDVRTKSGMVDQHDMDSLNRQLRENKSFNPIGTGNTPVCGWGL